MTLDRMLHDTSSISLKTWAWITIIVGSSLGFSLGFACAAPFAGLAAVAGSQLGRREASIAVLFAWSGNQSIGYLVLDYPRTWDSFAWGGAIGLAALAAVTLSGVVASRSMQRLTLITVPFAAAFAAYEGVLFTASFILPSEGNAFAFPIVARILEINAVAYAGLFVLHRLAVSVGFLAPQGHDRQATA